MSDEYVQQLSNVLQRVVTARSTQEVKSATEELQKNWYKRKETVVALVQILQSHTEAHIRQLCAVEVRKLIPRFWYESADPLDAETMENIKSSLLQNSLKEDNELVRHSVARIISAIASIDLDAKRWPNLLPELNRAVQSSDVRERETATYVLYALLDADYCTAAMENSAALFQVLSTTIEDPESVATRVNSVHALCSLAGDLVGEEALQFQPVVPKIVQVLRQCVDASDDKSAVKIFENLSDLVDCDPGVLGDSIRDLLVHMITDYGLNQQIEPDLRVAALRVVATAASYRWHRLKRLNLGPELTTKLVEVVASDNTEGEEEDDDEEDDFSPKQLALQTLGTLALNLPPSQVIAPLLRLLPTLIQAPNVHHQCAAFLAFSATAEEAPELVTSETGTLLPWVVGGLKSDNPSLRFAALGALVNLGEINSEAVGKEHATLVPLVYGMFDSAPSIKVVSHVSCALNTLLRSVNSTVISTDYLPGLMPRLLEVASTNSNLDLKRYVITSIGTAAEVAGMNFEPYFEQSVKALEPFLSVENLNVQFDRSSAGVVSASLGALCSFCSAVGAEKFAPYLSAWMKTALFCLQSEDSNLCDLAPLYISDIADVYREKFGPFVAHIVPALFKILNEEEVTFEDLNDEDDEEGDISEGLKVNSSLLLEKEYSLDCLGSLWKCVPAEPYLMPFFEDSLKHFKSNIDHYYEEARSSAINGLWHMYRSLPQSPEVKSTVWEATSEIFETEVEMSILEVTFSAIIDAVLALGPATFPGPEAVELLLDNIYNVVKKTHHVFEAEDYYDEEKEEKPGEESSEVVTRLVQTSLELLTKLASVLSTEFAPLFPKFAEMLQPYVTSSVDIERANGIGTIADLIGALKANISPYTAGLIEPLSAALTDSADIVRSVAAYGIGLLVEYSNESASIVPAFPTIFQHLGQILSSSNDDRTKANALGAIARLAAKHPDALPASQAEVVTLVLQYLPLKEAYEEYTAILPWLVSVQLPAEAKPVMEKLWQQHEEAKASNAVKSVTYLPVDDPLGDEKSMAAWNSIRQKLQ